MLAILESDEPDYARADRLGAETLPVLEELARTAEPLLASKAAHLASLVPAEGTVCVLEQAARRKEPEVRVAAAAALGNLRGAGNLGAVARLLDRLLHDPDAGVRRFAARTAASLHHVDASPAG
ncbi:MAG TPA: HEAT repeat domain-containing protein [Longimicrobiaceae bacterium]|nr:HEAT repeat domain-containing protein [Longimicrobiaceae bacterium]